MLEGPWGPIELWEAFGPTYPCIPRERIGDVLDGGKWCALGFGCSAVHKNVSMRQQQTLDTLASHMQAASNVPPHRRRQCNITSLIAVACYEERQPDTGRMWQSHQLWLHHSQCQY